MERDIVEDDICGEDGCDGKFVYLPVHNCTCFLNPPCNQCVHNPLVCAKCGREIEQ